ncbi:MAG: aminotransferase class I/II-fold pyridoxal phosphate-dependent enzyme [Tissierellia bacterium]|nr:aminotransferase class I/II-fold pyridoxal phosphate-dependent enzyme [Tissierellia bacterium]
MKDYQIGTRCVQAGWEPKNKDPRALPIYQSTTFTFDSSQDMAACFDLESDAYFYSRLANPTPEAVAKKIANLEGGEGAILTSSGQAANFYALVNICKAGDHIVSSSALYGGSYNLFANTLADMGIQSSFVAPDASLEEIEAAFRPNTKCLFGETLSNPALKVLDIEAFAQIAKEHGVPLIVDNTFATPIHCRPIEWGAHVVTHSTTKYMDGHAVALGGAIVDSGNFDWEAHRDKFPSLTTPNDSYHGLVFTENFGRGAYMAKMVATLMRDLGSTPSPFNAFLLNLGLETLHLRMARHRENGLAVAKFLANHPKIAWVKYPDLEGDQEYERAKKYLPQGSCGVVVFGVQGGREAAQTFMDGTQLAAIATHVADARTCLLHPASTTHRQMTDQELKEAGVSPDLIRLSVGIEDVEDIIRDLETSLAGI